MMLLAWKIPGSKKPQKLDGSKIHSSPGERCVCRKNPKNAEPAFAVGPPKREWLGPLGAPEYLVGCSDVQTADSTSTLAKRLSRTHFGSKHIWGRGERRARKAAPPPHGLAAIWCQSRSQPTRDQTKENCQVENKVIILLNPLTCKSKPAFCAHHPRQSDQFFEIMPKTLLSFSTSVPISFPSPPLSFQSLMASRLIGAC